MAAAEALPSPIAVALDVTGVLTRLDVPHLVGGSLGSSIHGEPRSTLDVDIVAALELRHVPPLVAALRPGYYLDENTAKGAVAAGQSFNAVHLATAVKVDLFVAGRDPFDAERLRTRVLVSIGEATASIYVDLPEYGLLRKLEWYRRGGEVSDRQWRDALGILRVQGSTLDRSRMETWAAQLGVADLLEKLLLHAGHHQP